MIQNLEFEMTEIECLGFAITANCLVVFRTVDSDIQKPKPLLMVFSSIMHPFNRPNVVV